MRARIHVGFPRILVFVVAGSTGTILLVRGKFSEWLGKVMGQEIKKSEDDFIAAQVRRLAMEVRRGASAPQMIFLNVNTGPIGQITSILVVATISVAFVYAYMRCKGVSLSDYMILRKHHLADASSNLTKDLEQLPKDVAATEKDLTQKMEKLEDKMESQIEMSDLIKKDLKPQLTNMIERVDAIEEKQDTINHRLQYVIEMWHESLKGIEDNATRAGYIDGSTSSAIVQDGADNRLKANQMAVEV